MHQNLIYCSIYFITAPLHILRKKICKKIGMLIIFLMHDIKPERSGPVNIMPIMQQKHLSYFILHVQPALLTVLPLF